MTETTTEKDSNETADLDGAVLEYRDSIQKAIEIESEKLKDKVERDSSQILTRARDEARKTVSRARQEAGLESERIISEAREEAARIVSQAKSNVELEHITTTSKEEAGHELLEYCQRLYDEALQESALVIGGVKEKVSQVISEIIENSLTRVKDDLTRISSEANADLDDRTSRMLARTNERVEEIISQTKNKIQSKLEMISDGTVGPGSETQSSSDVQNNNHEPTPLPVVEEEVSPAAPVSEKTGSVSPSSGNDESENDGDMKLFKGRLKVEIICSSFKETRWVVQDELARVPGLKVISTNSYTRGNNQIVANVVELAQPMPLLKTIKSKMDVKDIVERKGCILVTSN